MTAQTADPPRHGRATTRRHVNVLLISTYELGRQPFGLASPAAWLRRPGTSVCCLDLSVEQFSDDAVRAADLVAFYIPMHMATRMAVRALVRVREVNPRAHICFYGLYAMANADYLRKLGVDTVLGGEFEAGLVRLVERLATSGNGQVHMLPQVEPLVSLDRQTFKIPDRSGLPDPRQYAHLVAADGRHLTVGYVEASRGCKHHCRHCPIVPVYHGRFRIVQRDVVLADIRQQVAAGAQHITFGDPDFFNGPGHAVPLVTELHREFPDLTYDVTIKVEHLLKQMQHLDTLRETGCLFVTSAVESFDERVLRIFEKHHSKTDLETVLERFREIDLTLVPTFVAFTPWLTLEGYRSFLSEIVRLELVDHVPPIQYAIRLLIPPESRLLELPEVQDLVEMLDEEQLCYRWRNPDPRVDKLQVDLERLIQECLRRKGSRRETFRHIWERAFRNDVGQLATRCPAPSGASRFIPYLTEPWYC